MQAWIDDTLSLLETRPVSLSASFGHMKRQQSVTEVGHGTGSIFPRIFNWLDEFCIFLSLDAVQCDFVLAQESQPYVCMANIPDEDVFQFPIDNYINIPDVSVAKINM